MPLLTVFPLAVQRKTGQCFALNGVIFLGSVLLWERAMAPGARYLLATSLQVRAGQAPDSCKRCRHATLA